MHVIVDCAMPGSARRAIEKLLEEQLGASVCHFGGDSPDTSGQNQAALQQAALSKEQLDWMKQIYADSEPQRQQTTALQNELAGEQIGLMRKASSTADEAAARQRDVFQPLQDQLIANAKGYNTESRRESEAGQAMSDVSTQTALARQGVIRELADRGVDASSGNAAVALTRSAVLEGAQRAAAGNTARKQVEMIGDAKLADAVNMGNGNLTNQASQTQLALTSGNSAGAQSGAANASNVSGSPLMQAGYQGAQAGLAGAAGTLGQIGQINAQTSAAQSQGAGTAIGMAAMYFI